jgi:integrase
MYHGSGQFHSNAYPALTRKLRPGRPVPRGKISKKTVDALICPAGKDREFLWDGALSGFGVVAMASGLKSYIVQFRHDGRSRRFAIGPHGRLTPDQAREEAKRLLGDATLGMDPAKARQTARNVPIFRDVADAYLNKHVRMKRKPRTFEGYETLLRLHILPVLGGMKLTEIRRKNIEALHRKIGAPGAANRAVSLVSAILNFAAGVHEDLDLPTNPAKGIAGNREQGRERFLSGPELARLGAALRLAETDGIPWRVDEGKPGAKHLARPENRNRVIDLFALAAIRLLLLTGARLREILHAKWEWLDQENGFLTLPDSKTGRKVIFLNGGALAILAGLPRIEGNPYIIPGRVDGKPRADLHLPWAAIRQAAGLEGVRLHDLRHSFASTGAGAGLGLPVIGALLGHTTPNMTARYAHLAAGPVKRAANEIGAILSAALGAERPK